MRRGYRIAQGRHKLGSTNHPRKNVGAKADSAPRQPRRDAQARDGSPNPERHRASPTPSHRHDSSVARRAAELSCLCAFAAWREKNNADPTTTCSERRSPEHPDRSRKAASRQELVISAIVGDTQAVGIRAGGPAQGRIATHVRDIPDLSAALRLCARQTTLPRPAPARRDDRRQTRTGRAEPQRRRALTSSVIVGDTQTVGIGAGRAEPQSRRGLLPLRLCGLAREKQRRAEPSRPRQRREPKSRAPPRLAHSEQSPRL
jgi:hypothetical protein